MKPGEKSGETAGDDRGEGLGLAALQSQINDLKERIERQEAHPLAAQVARLEDAMLSIADLFADLRLSCFGTDRREDVKKVAAVAAAIRSEREGKTDA